MTQIQLLSAAELQPILQKEFGSRIRAERKKRHLSQAALARFCGLHVSHLSKIERGKANATVASLVAIALAMNEIELLPSEAKLIVQQELGNRIRTERKKRHMSQSDLAHFCGLHVSRLSEIERGKANATVASLVSIALALKMNPFGPLLSIPLSKLQNVLPQAERNREPGRQESIPHRYEV